MNPVSNSNLKRKFEEEDLPQVKVPRLGNISDTIDKIHEVAELSGKDLRLPETIQKLNELVQSLLREDARSESLGKDLNVIYQRLDVNQLAQKEVASKISQIIHKDFSLQAISKDYGFSSDRGTVLALYASQEISISTVKRFPEYPDHFTMQLKDGLNCHGMNLTKEIFSIKPKLAEKLTDDGLEAIFKYSESDKLKLIEVMNLSLADFPLLGERAVGLFLKYCPKSQKEVFINLPENLCNQKLFEKGSNKFLNVNRDLLMAFSDYFKTQWESSYKEGSKSEKTEIEGLDWFRICLDLALADRVSQSFETLDELQKAIQSCFSSWFVKYGEVMNISFLHSVVHSLDYYHFKNNREIIQELIWKADRFPNRSEEDEKLLKQMVEIFEGLDSKSMYQQIDDPWLLISQYNEDPC